MPTATEPLIGSGTILEERPETLPSDGGDHEKFAHYADKDKITNAMVFGTPVQALCGKKWVPTRDGSKFPVCPDCKRIYDELPDGPSGQNPQP